VAIRKITDSYWPGLDENFGPELSRQVSFTLLGTLGGFFTATSNTIAARKTFRSSPLVHPAGVLIQTRLGAESQTGRSSKTGRERGAG